MVPSVIMAIRSADRLFLSFFLTEGWFSNGCRKSFAQKNSEAACTRNGSRSTKPVWRVHRLLVQSPHLCKGSPRSVEAEQGKCKLIHLQQERIKLRYLILLVILVIISIIFVVLPFIFGRSPYGPRNNWSCPVGHNFAVNWRIRVTFKVHVIWFRVCQDTLSLEKTWVGSQSALR